MDKNGVRSPYARLKLMFSIYRALPKQTDPQDVEDLTNTIEARLLDIRSRNLQTNEITDTVLKVLKNYDPAVFMRYLSNREDINSLKQLKQELQNLS